MRALTAELPRQLGEGFRAGLAAAPRRAARKPVPTFVVGMGGSGIAAELVRAVVEAETAIPYFAVRNFALPVSAGKGSLVILSSQSGNTWETLRAYEEAGARGARRIALTSGGELARRAERDGVPMVTLPPGGPPRGLAAVMTGVLLAVLDPWFERSNTPRVDALRGRLERRETAYARRGGVAERLARTMGPRIPYFFVEPGLVPVARRWKSTMEENAKRIAVWEECPEFFHNAIVGWDAILRGPIARYVPMVLDWNGTHPDLGRSYRYLERLLRARGARPVHVSLPGDDLLEALLSGVLLGDHCTIFLAEAAGIDPEITLAIVRLKEHLA